MREGEFLRSAWGKDYEYHHVILQAVHESGVTLPTKDDDFFPYASDPHAFWTGYFTSRCAKFKIFLQSLCSLGYWVHCIIYFNKLIANSHDRNRNTKKLNFLGKLFKGKTGSIPGSKV